MHDMTAATSSSESSMEEGAIPEGRSSLAKTRCKINYHVVTLFIFMKLRKGSGLVGSTEVVTK